MTQTSGMKLYGIIGHPIGHSLSPLMHNTAFKTLGMSASMDSFDIQPQSLKEALDGFVALDFGGLNVTIPHKEAIIPLLDEVDEEASIIGAVNTVSIDNKRTAGFNTDSYGFLKTLEPHRSAIEGRKFLVLGAGGAARAVVYVLLKHFRTNQIVIASRTVSRTNDLIENFRRIGQTNLSSFNSGDPQFPLILQASDVIINATPAGMFPKTNELPVSDPKFRKGQLVVDLIYRPLQTELLRRAAEAGAQTVSGLEMFVNQGARAFEIWTSQSMDTHHVREVILHKLEETT